MSRQNYYATRRRRQARAVDESLVVELIRRERDQQPRLGVRKLHVVLREEWMEAGVSVGRDRLFGIAREHDLLVAPIKAWRPRTTDSRHTLPVFHNEVQGVETTGSNQVWVADLTYLRTREGYMFLALIMDRHSRMIVGWCCAETLEAIGCLEALNMALSRLPAGVQPVHHSDQGCQYACHLYVDRLHAAGLRISMTESRHCYENAHAERLNGVLKQEYGLGIELATKEQARRASAQAVLLYNTRRPHAAVGYRTPQMAHAA